MKSCSTSFDGSCHGQGREKGSVVLAIDVLGKAAADHLCGVGQALNPSVPLPLLDQVPQKVW